jgi:hypothetical protein
MTTVTLKECFDAVAPVLINQSLNEGLFPNQWKIAKAIPIYKTGVSTHGLW